MKTASKDSGMKILKENKIMCWEDTGGTLAHREPRKSPYCFHGITNFPLGQTVQNMFESTVQPGVIKSSLSPLQSWAVMWTAIRSSAGSSPALKITQPSAWEGCGEDGREGQQSEPQPLRTSLAQAAASPTGVEAPDEK